MEDFDTFSNYSLLIDKFYV